MHQETGGRSQTYRKIFWQIKQEWEFKKTAEKKQPKLSSVRCIDPPQGLNRLGSQSPDAFLPVFDSE